MDDNFLQLNAQVALLALVLAMRALGTVPPVLTGPAAVPESWTEQQLVVVCEAAPRSDRGYLGALTDSMLATAGGDGVAFPDRVGRAIAC